MIITVAADGSGQFTRLQDAIDFAPSGEGALVIIRVRLGDYREKVHITKSNLRIIGDTAERTRIVFGDNAKQTYPDGREKGTFLSYTMIITGNNVELENLTVENDAGPGRIVGQAIALYAAGDRIALRNCRLLGHQDTLFCGPTMANVADNAKPYILPVMQESAGDALFSVNRVYFEGCHIQGDVDFIFGPYRCWFDKCKLVCSSVNGYYTAANTPFNQPHGFVFSNCHLKGEGSADNTVYLGRPWRAYARTVFLNCRMDECVQPEGWQDWGDKPVTYRYAEYGTIGERSDVSLRHRNTSDSTEAEFGTRIYPSDLSPRHKNASILSEAEATALTPQSVLGGADGWNPLSPIPTVYLCGDSTCCDYPEDVYPRTGWGQALAAHLNGRRQVQNEAASGHSSKSFIAEGRLNNIEHCLRPSDLLLIQFGHNDEKEDRERATDAYTFPLYLSAYIDAARAHDAEPVLLTPIVRRAFKEGKVTDTHGEYVSIIRRLAKERGVRLIDLERLTRDALARMGEEHSKEWFLYVGHGHRNYADGVSDDTHLSFDGAYAIAGMVNKSCFEGI
jgi:pectinesterase